MIEKLKYRKGMFIEDKIDVSKLIKQIRNQTLDEVMKIIIQVDRRCEEMDDKDETLTWAEALTILNEEIQELQGVIK